MHSGRLLRSLAIAFAFSCASSSAFADKDSGKQPPAGGDEPSTFGQTMIYLGMSAAGSINFDSTCVFAPPDALPPGDRCVVLQPAPAATNFDFPDMGSVYLPGGSTRSIVWPIFTYNTRYQLNNTTGVPQPHAIFRVRTIVTIESEVLNDPSLIDPATGLPYNGKFVTAFTYAVNADRTLAVGERIADQMRFSGTGHASFDTETFLQSNIPAKTVEKMFNKPMTVRLGVSGRVQLLDEGFVRTTMRLMGDK